MRLMLLLPAIGAALHLIGFKRTRDALALLAAGRKAQPAADSPAETEQAQRLARLVSISANHGPYRATCLRQSLALWWLLRRRGIAAELRLGVRKDQGELLAHAWVEHEGQALNDAQGVTKSYAAFSPAIPTEAVCRQ
ncbi:MAG: lasso peptide biosynthesis B2 protein [Chromatiaceae bacterium]|nr:lasso peptide biosynthesis B2 protein [Chromatiaceae bacterium]